MKGRGRNSDFNTLHFVKIKLKKKRGTRLPFRGDLTLLVLGVRTMRLLYIVWIHVKGAIETKNRLGRDYIRS